MQIYALALEKGGVGKTCLAVNLAAAFSRLNLRVLVIDLDAQAQTAGVTLFLLKPFSAYRSVSAS
jgi:cellulose biosynthesis protein BcsQ